MLPLPSTVGLGLLSAYSVTKYTLLAYCTGSISTSEPFRVPLQIRVRGDGKQLSLLSWSLAAPMLLMLKKSSSRRCNPVGIPIIVSGVLQLCT